MASGPDVTGDAAISSCAIEERQIGDITDQPGDMHMHAEYDPGAAVLAVTVADQGSWLMADSEQRDLAPGRGIPLMHALAERALSTDPPTARECAWNGPPSTP